LSAIVPTTAQVKEQLAEVRRELLQRQASLHEQIVRLRTQMEEQGSPFFEQVDLLEAEVQRQRQRSTDLMDELLDSYSAARWFESQDQSDG
jgi:RNA polymerase-binding transcription factor DksA